MIVNAKLTNIPIVQKILHSFGAFREIFLIKLFNFFVFSKAIKGKKTVIASFLFRKTYIRIKIMSQNVRESKNHGFRIKSKIKSMKSIYSIFSLFLVPKLIRKIKLIGFKPLIKKTIKEQKRKLSLNL